MATDAEDALPDLYEGRAEAGIAGFRTHTIALVIRSGVSARTEQAEVETPITEALGQPPRIRWLSDEELAVGGLPAGTVEVGPITPKHATGGTDIALLRGDELAVGSKLLFRIRGPKAPGGALFVKVALGAGRALRYMLQLKPAELEDNFP